MINNNKSKDNECEIIDYDKPLTTALKKARYETKQKEKLCICCDVILTKSNVYGGFMGTLYKLLMFGKGWRDFNICQKCRDMQERINLTDQLNNDKNE